MSLEEVSVQGTLKPDGTLVLDQRPNLSPGRVSVVLRPVRQLPPTSRSSICSRGSRRLGREPD